MTKKWTPVRAGAWRVVAVTVLDGCHATKSCGVEFVPFPQHVSTEEYTSHWLLEILSMAVQVATETGGELTTMGLLCVQVCGSGDTQGYRVIGYTTVVPSMSFEQPGRLVTENKPNQVVAVQADKENDRDATWDIRLIDNYGSLTEFKLSEDSIAVRSRSACLPTGKPLNDPGQFVLPSMEGAFLGVRVVINDSTNPGLHPLPALTSGAHVAPQSDTQSGIQSGEQWYEFLVDDNSSCHLRFTAPYNVYAGAVGRRRPVFWTR